VQAQFSGLMVARYFRTYKNVTAGPKLQKLAFVFALGGEAEI
jgi:hypothetical protein